MAPHSSTLAWKIPWTEEPGGLQSMGSLSVGYDWATSLSCIGEGNGNPLQYSCLENPRNGGAWWAAICGVAQSQTRLKRLSSSSRAHIITCFSMISVKTLVGKLEFPCKFWFIKPELSGAAKWWCQGWPEKTPWVFFIIIRFFEVWFGHLFLVWYPQKVDEYNTHS